MIPQVEELSDMERHHFESVISIYAGGAGRHFYERYLKRTQHPDALAYLERVIPIAAARSGMAGPR